MGWSVSVTSPKTLDLPDVNEPIFSFSSCAGNICSSVAEMKGKHLSAMDRDEALTALKDLIKEIDKQPIKKLEDVSEIINNSVIGDTIMIKVIREGTSKILFSEIEKKPADISSKF